MTEYLFGFDEFTGYLNRLAGRLDRALQEALTSAALLLEREAKQNIAGGRPEWPRLSRSTVLSRIRRRQAGRRALARARRLRRAGASAYSRAAALKRGMKSITNPFTPLYDTGTLMRSITHEVEPHRAIVGPTVEYATVHEFGGRAGRGRRIRVPARPFLRPAARESMDDLRRIFRLRIERAARRR